MHYSRSHFLLSICFTIISLLLAYVWRGRICSYLCLSKQDLDLLISFQTLLFSIRPGNLKKQVFTWQVNKTDSKLTISLLLCSPIKAYLLIAEENNHIITCVQCRAPAGSMERRWRDMSGAAKQQRKHNILFASCSSHTHSPTEINLHVSNFAEAGQA